MTTTVVYAGTADGFIRSDSDASYATARAGSGTLGETTASDQVYVGQADDTGDSGLWIVWEGFLGFDTSAIDDGDTVSAAVLNVTSYGDYSTTDFTIQARLSDWGATLTTADYVAGASLSGLTLLATYATSSGFTLNTAYNFTDSAMPANVSKTGTTPMILCSDRTASGTLSGSEFVVIKSADTTGTTSDPKLTVTHAAAAPAGYAHSFAVIL